MLKLNFITQDKFCVTYKVGRSAMLRGVFAAFCNKVRFQGVCARGMLSGLQLCTMLPTDLTSC